MRVLLQLAWLNLSIITGVFVYLFNKQGFSSFLNRTLIKHGPVYIKLGQVLSTRTDILPDNIINSLSKLRDNVSVENQQAFHQIVNEQIVGKGIHSYDSECIAAGSVAAVFKGIDSNKSPVAIKVIRPGIDEVIKDNFNVLKMIVNMMSVFSSTVRSVNIKGIIEELEELLLSQTDLTKEAENYERFRESYKHNSNIVLPQVYKGLTSETVLVTEFVDAITPYDFDQIDIDTKQFAKKVDRILDDMVFIKGVAHADLHPGNFFLTKNGDLILIDLGLVHSFSQEERNNIMAFYFAFVEEHYDIATKHFLNNFLIETDRSIHDEQGEISNELYQEVYSVVESQNKETGGNPQFSIIFNELMKIMYKYRLQLVSNYSKMFLTLATIEGYLYSIDPEFDMVENARLAKMELAEYTSIPDEAERLVLEDYGTYSTARFEDNCSPREAYEKRDQLIFNLLNLNDDDILLDVGCGRGKLLEKAKEYHLRPIGVTIDKIEHQVCQDKGLESICTSWEDFENNIDEEFPLVNAITAIEVLYHLGSMNENRAGLVDRRLGNYFEWAYKRLDKSGKMFIQSLNINELYLHDNAYKNERSRIEAKVPWLGFTTLEQIQKHSADKFDILYQVDHSEDLLPTFKNQLDKIQQNETRLRQLIKPELFEYIIEEINVMIELSEKGYLKLNRILMFKKEQQSMATIAA